MAKVRPSRSIGVWMNGELVGFWGAPPNGRQEFVYAESWLVSAFVRPISLSLPLRPSSEPYRTGVESFFENLLPDNRAVRERIQRRFQTDSARPFDLLSQIGRDCVGALQLLPEGEVPTGLRQITGEPLTPRGIAEHLSAVLGNPITTTGNEAHDFRISVAGAQEKTGLLWHEGKWHRPTGSTPTTHLLKLPIGEVPSGLDLSTSVENEWLCGRILAAYGVPVARSEIASFGQFKTLVVERFDRRPAPDGSWWLRLPQEDFCQATGTAPAAKYESEGGPGIERILEILRGSDQPDADRLRFLRLQVLFWVLAATDGHAKNFSIFLLPGGSFNLTPCYDVLSVHPYIGHGHGKLARQKVRMAMAVRGTNRHYHWDGIHRSHWIETARRCGFSRMPELLDEIRAMTPEVVEKVRTALPSRFPSAIAEPILEGIATSAERLA